MFIDESGADLSVTVEGDEYHTEASIDVDSDGLGDTAIVETDDGTIAFTDTNADGQADLMTQLDANGDIVGQARFDQATGEWVHVDDPGADHGAFSDNLWGKISGSVPPPDAAADGSMTVDTPAGDVQLGTPTHDTDADGRDDSVVVTDTEGDTLIYTDADRDGDADYLTEFTEDGRITIAEHQADGDGDWAIIERGHLDEHGVYHRDPLAPDPGTLAAEESGWINSGQHETTEIHVDPRTGNWIRG